MDTIQSNIFAIIIGISVIGVVFIISFFIYHGSLKDNASQCIESGGQWKVSEKDDGDGNNTQYECVR